jgi:hypothetical protein
MERVNDPFSKACELSKTFVAFGCACLSRIKSRGISRLVCKPTPLAVGKC